MRFEHQLSDRREIAFAKSSGSGDRPVVFRDYMPTPAKNDIGQRVALDEEIRGRHVAKRLYVWQILFEDLNSLAHSSRRVLYSLDASECFTFVSMTTIATSSRTRGM